MLLKNNSEYLTHQQLKLYEAKQQNHSTLTSGTGNIHVTSMSDSYILFLFFHGSFQTRERWRLQVSDVMICLLSFQCNFISTYLPRLPVAAETPCLVLQKLQSTAIKVPLSSIQVRGSWQVWKHPMNTFWHEEGLSVSPNRWHCVEIFDHHLGNDCFPMLASLKHYLC